MSKPREKQNLHCNRCGRETAHRVIREYRRRATEAEKHWREFVIDSETGLRGCWGLVSYRFLMAECAGCGEVQFLRGSEYELDFESVPYSVLGVEACGEDPWARVELVSFPPRVRRRPPEWLAEIKPWPEWVLSRLDPRQREELGDGRLPEAAIGLIEEVYRALNDDCPRLAVMGMRSIIDVVCQHKLGDIGGFQRKLESLVNGEFISSRDRDILASAVEAGHAVIHRGHEPSRSMTDKVFDIVESMLHRMYYQPILAKGLSETTPNLQRNRRT